MTGEQEPCPWDPPFFLPSHPVGSGEERVVVNSPWRTRGEHRDGFLGWVKQTLVCSAPSAAAAAWLGAPIKMCGVCRECTWQMAPAVLSCFHQHLSFTRERGDQPRDGLWLQVCSRGRVHQVRGPPVWTGAVILHTCSLKGR